MYRNFSEFKSRFKMTINSIKQIIDFDLKQKPTKWNDTEISIFLLFSQINKFTKVLFLLIRVLSLPTMKRLFVILSILLNIWKKKKKGKVGKVNNLYVDNGEIF